MMRVMIVICNVHMIWLKVVLGALFAQNERRAEGSKLGRVASLDLFYHLRRRHSE